MFLLCLKNKNYLRNVLVFSLFNFHVAFYIPCLDCVPFSRIQVLLTVPWLNIDKRSKMHSVYLFRKICTKTPPCLYSKIPFVRFYSQKGHSHNISTFLQSFSDNFSTPSNYFLLLFKSKSIQSLIFL